MSQKWIQTADWKTEKHIPVIEIEKVKEGRVNVKVTVGKEIPHPNTTAHHIKWVDLFLWPDDEKFPVEIGYVSFDTHGESAKGADTSSVYTEPCAVFTFTTKKAGTLMATAYCNIHGLWKSEKELKL